MTEAPWEVIRRAADELDAVLDGDLGNKWVRQAGSSVVEPLIAWLRDAAEAAEEHQDSKTAPVNMGERLCSNELKALDLARAVLGEQP